MFKSISLSKLINSRKQEPRIYQSHSSSSISKISESKILLCHKMWNLSEITDSTDKLPTSLSF